MHVRISSPPVRYPCYFGMDFPTSDELIANGRNIEEIEDILGADSLGYLSLEGAVSATSQAKDKFCTACFSGEYPIKIL